MALAGVTQQSVMEAGIAADLAANPNLLPPAISELSDQAAIFASNNVNAFMFTGSADADSENTNFGEALATKAIEKIIEMDERRRKENGEPDADAITALAASQREQLRKMQETTAVYANGQFTMFGMTVGEDDLNTAIDNALQDYDAYADRHGIPQEDRAAHYSYLLGLRDAPPQEQARMMTERAQENPSGKREMRGLMEDAAEVGRNRTADADMTQADTAEIVANAEPEIAIDLATDGTASEQNAVAAQIDNTTTWETARSAQGYADREIDDLSERRSITGGDELAAMFGDVADDRQFADAGEVTAPAPRTDSNPALGLG